MRAIFARLSGDKVRIYGLVLTSAGIPHQIQRRGHHWAITVSSRHRAAAINAVALYFKENPEHQRLRNFQTPPGLKTYSALYIVTILALIHGTVRPGYEQRVFVESLGADAARILSGDLYRTITALLLHKDWAHVVNNMASMALFGTVTASICGWGMGWLLILLSGGLGNVVTALWYRQDHLSIGASTAVFGALGICVALNLWRQTRIPQPSWRMWLPLAGGVALLAFLGMSPHSDVMAHMAGFGCGVVIGGIYGWLCKRPPGFAVQWASAIVGVGLVAVSWIIGVYYAGG